MMFLEIWAAISFGVVYLLAAITLIVTGLFGDFPFFGRFCFGAKARLGMTTLGFLMCTGALTSELWILSR